MTFSNKQTLTVCMITIGGLDDQQYVTNGGGSLRDRVHRISVTFIAR